METQQTLAVLGAGTMGNGIAHVFARAGHDVISWPTLRRLRSDRGLETVRKNLAREVTKARLTAKRKSQATAGAHPAYDGFARRPGCGDAGGGGGDRERFEIKSQLFQKLDAVMPAEAILASNTSSAFRSRGWQR